MPTPASLSILLWTLLVLTLVPLTYLVVKLWLNRKRRRSRRYTLQARKTYFGGTFIEPSIDFDELENRK